MDTEPKPEYDDEGNVYNDPHNPSRHNELWGSDPKCIHHIIHGPGGGIVCEKCGGWFCY